MRILGRNSILERRRVSPLTFAERWDLYAGPSIRSPQFSCDEDRRAAWETHRAEILARWQRTHPGRRPWAWWQYDHPQVEREIDEAAQLARMGELTPEEAEAVRAAKAQDRMSPVPEVHR